MTSPIYCPPATFEDDPQHIALLKTWTRHGTLIGWIASTDHKQIGLRFVKTAFTFFVLAGSLAVMMRLQLALPNNRLLGPDLYNQFFTTHGTAMMFLFAVPVMEGMGLYLVPLMVGTRNVSFPRLMNFGYWLYFLSGVSLFTGLLFNMGPDVGWFAYTPLSGPGFSPGHRVDLWSQMVTMVEIASMASAICIIATIFTQRAPGMSLNRIPLFVWSMVVTSIMVIFAMPAVMLDSSYLIFDRTMSMHFFNQSEGGDALFYQHLFWFFGHPEVYIVFMPGLGFISSIVTAFTGRKIFGYTAIVSTLVITGFLGFSVWVHHMFATGLPQLGQSFFTAASLMIVIPTAVQMFCWIATMWSGRLRVATPMLFVFAFFLTFTIGGMSGIMVGSVPLDWQLHDTYFIVAHLHYVLIGGAIFSLFGAFYFWFPKWTGRMYDEALGQFSFWLLLIGFNVTFFPMHILGLRGMPRRVYTYQPGMGWEALSRTASIGAALIALGVLMMLINFAISRRSGVVAGANPWNADTLEWSISSPPPVYNFLHIPVVSGANAVWDAAPDQPYVTGMRFDRREVLVTKTLDAEPDHREEMPAHSIYPFILALTTTLGLAGSIFYAWWFVVGMILTTIAGIGWFWPSKEDVREELRREMAMEAVRD